MLLSFSYSSMRVLCSVKEKILKNSRTVRKLVAQPNMYFFDGHMVNTQKAGKELSSLLFNTARRHKFLLNW